MKAGQVHSYEIGLAGADGGTEDRAKAFEDAAFIVDAMAERLETGS